MPPPRRLARPRSRTREPPPTDSAVESAAPGGWTAQSDDGPHDHEIVVREDEPAQICLEQDRSRLAFARDPARNAAQQDTFRAEPVGEGELDAERLQREGAAGAGGGIGGDAGRHVRPERQRPGTEEQVAAGPDLDPMSERVVRERPIRIHVVFDDLADRVRLHVVDPLESGHDRLLRRGEGRRHRHETRVAASLRAGVVGRFAQLGEAALAARRNRRVHGDRRGGLALVRGSAPSPEAGPLGRGPAHRREAARRAPCSDSGSGDPPSRHASGGRGKAGRYAQPASGPGWRLGLPVGGHAYLHDSGALPDQ